MEQSEAYKSVEDKIQTIAKKIALYDKKLKECEQSGKLAENEIEEHFAKLMSSLAARKHALMNEVEEKVIKQSMYTFYIVIYFVLLLLQRESLKKLK